ncbi:prolyl oligopeptidase family serine peptidase [Rhodococcus sp. X156]|uniref:S9 family peptidase n=1 Tax=Rhodococcus sp. X156 TaxID=2499145 RepID=UPI000FD954F5|nr:prolyl oligopeptidase family serine peptidase [Rhodococcus sp. X156]
MTTQHPAAPVPETLFDDPAAEARWRARFTAPRISLPDWALHAPDRNVFSSNASGTWEIYTWDRLTDLRRQVTDRPSGTHGATISPDGAHVWWFDDTDGDEFGHWVAEPFAGRPTDWTPQQAVAGTTAGYPAGLELGSKITAIAASTDEGTTIWATADRTRAAATQVVYAHAQDAGTGALSRDETLLAIHHSEHGDSRHPALRVFRLAADGSVTETVAELHDGEGKGLDALAFAPVEGDTRLLVNHERRGRDELVIWDVATGEQTELAIDLPGDLSGDFYLDGTALVVVHTHAGRSTLHRYDLITGALSDLDTPPGSIGGADARPDASVEYSWSSAEQPSMVRVRYADGTDAVLLTPPDADPAPASQPLEDAWVGDVHALVARPAGADGPLPTVFSLHGGPHAADEDRYSAMRATWLDAGFAVVHVNYRGSTGYGSAWRDAIEGRPGLTELADVAAVQDWAVASGLADPDRCVVEGWSWGGYLSLLAAGTQPDRWAAVIAGVPVADYLAAFADEMEPLRAYDRALFGGSPEELPELYAECSPLTYVDAVRAPVLILAGENDPRCPIRQVDNYLDGLAAGGKRYEMVRYDAGHGSLVVAELVQHVATEVDFARRMLGLG